ncbi:MAG: PqqD family protein [Candidatus Omnitrophota bacterium]|nr:PqqD family protein [Candidatus Omnitrophota bacterium]
MKQKAYPVRNPDIVMRSEPKEALLFNPADGNMLCINETGILIWGLCDGDNATDDIVRKLTEVYDVSGDKAREDYDSFIKEMDEAGFIGYKT